MLPPDFDVAAAVAALSLAARKALLRLYTGESPGLDTVGMRECVTARYTRGPLDRALTEKGEAVARAVWLDGRESVEAVYASLAPESRKVLTDAFAARQPGASPADRERVPSNVPTEVYERGLATRGPGWLPAKLSPAGLAVARAGWTMDGARTFDAKLLRAAADSAAKNLHHVACGTYGDDFDPADRLTEWAYRCALPVVLQPWASENHPRRKGYALLVAEVTAHRMTRAARRWLDPGREGVPLELRWRAFETRAGVAFESRAEVVAPYEFTAEASYDEAEDGRWVWSLRAGLFVEGQTWRSLRHGGFVPAPPGKTVPEAVNAAVRAGAGRVVRALRALGADADSAFAGR